MKNGFSTPDIRMILPFYYPGFVLRAIHYEDNDGTTIPYDLHSDYSITGVMRHEDSGHTRGITSALNHYLDRMRKLRYPNFPRVVTIDEAIDLDLILREFARTGLRHIQMQPQQ